VVAAATAAALLVGACGDKPGNGGGPGEDLYVKNCATCHGGSGGGGIGPSLQGIGDKYTLDEHIAIIAEGRNNMPAWKNSLKPDEIKAVAEYERSL
jgi:cytochrome c551